MGGARVKIYIAKKMKRWIWLRVIIYLFLHYLGNWSNSSQRRGLARLVVAGIQI